MVEDRPELSGLFQKILNLQNLPVAIAASLAELNQLLTEQKPALILLDLNLPDGSGLEALNSLIPEHPGTSILIITGNTDLDTALTCLRLGVDDYLVKPVNTFDLQRAVNRSLEKRRLILDNIRYQKKLEQGYQRARFLHELNLKMNSAYLNRQELHAILRAILTGITSGQGLGFNRAFLALISDDGRTLQGRMAIGPASKEEASKVWTEIREQNLNLDDILNRPEMLDYEQDTPINNIARRISIPTSAAEHLLIKTCNQRISHRVTGGHCIDEQVPEELLTLLAHDTFVAVPLYSPGHSLGVILADNSITNRSISDNDLFALEIFAGQASLAIEHSHLSEAMQHKIRELEEMGVELEKNKDLLVNAERDAALGQMSAQLVHTLRNPITTIGGVSRMLARKFDHPENNRFLNIIEKEAGRIEKTLEDLFIYVDTRQPQKELQQLQPLIRKSLMLFYGQLKKEQISYQLNLPGEPILIHMDNRHIQQLLVHLIRNAMEAMTNGGQLSITCSRDEQTATITITDTGCGVVNGNLDRVGDPFFTTKIYGTGMGLTLVEKIATDHGGSFHLDQDPNQGMTATVHLPLTENN